MRGSREISLVPSLHRASTDALIPTGNRVKNANHAIHRSHALIYPLGHRSVHTTIVKLTTSILNAGSCVNASFNGCCTGADCEVFSSSTFPISCFCDVLCYTYDDCCNDITSIGCVPGNG